MTTASKLRSAILDLRSICAELNHFAAKAQRETEWETFSRSAREAGDILEGIERRLEEVEREEPQYHAYPTEEEREMAEVRDRREHWENLKH